MMAVADAAENPKKFKPPPEVAIASYVTKWGDPWGGGWMEWPAGMPKRLNVAENITSAFQLLRHYDGKFGDWESSHPFEASIFHEITALRMAKAANNGS